MIDKYLSIITFLSGKTSFTMYQLLAVTINKETAGVYYTDLNHCKYWETIFGFEISCYWFLDELIFTILFVLYQTAQSLSVGQLFALMDQTMRRKYKLT